MDFIKLDSLLDETESILKNSVRAFVDLEILPSIGRHFDEATFPDDLPKKLGNAGYLGAFIPEEYGGSGSTYAQYGIICEELERGDSGVRSFASVQSSLVMFPIWKYGSEEQKKNWLPLLAKGEKIGCFGLTEPDFGSNPGGMITKARKVGETYVLNGSKRWITNANIADICVVWAKEEDGEVYGYLVEKGAKGLSQVKMEKKMSLRASHTGELIFEDCVIPASNKLPNIKGLKGPLSCLDSARFGIIWGVLGAGEACYQCALDYSKSRTQFTVPLAGHQLVQSKLVWMLTELTKGKLLAVHLARLRDSGQGHHTQTSIGKMNNVSVALQCARLARDILGANGISTEYPVIRHMLNLESVNTYEGTEDIHRLILGKEITGIGAF
jgi:glutaryl-CoA dehydrogenase